MNMRILGFPAEVLDRLGRFHGFSGEVERYLPAIFAHLAVRERGSAEEDPSFKQLVPYVVFVSGGQRGGVEAGVPATRSLRGGAQAGVPATRSLRGGAQAGVPATRSLRGGVQVFRYVRGKRGSEARLHELHSIGVGGHIEVTDVSLFAHSYDVGMRREIDEEVELPPGGGRQRVIGMINDDSTPVGQVHFGVVHLWELPAPKLRRRESSLARTGFAPLDDLLRDRDKFETWSQFVLDRLAAQEGI
jgi:predicted NUDIX family phosphoesterase